MTREHAPDRASPIPVTTRDGREYIIRPYVVCFVDLSGQSKRLQGWPTLPRDGRPTSELVEAVQKTVGTVREFRDMFKGFFEGYKQRKPAAAELSQLLPEKREEFLEIRARMRKADVTVQQFSDAFVFYAPDADEVGNQTDALIRMIGAAAFGLLWGLAHGNAFRAGITVESGTEIDRGNFYGPALDGAYKMEQKVAEYPRVVLSREAVEFAYRAGGFSADTEIERRLIENYLSPSALLCKDSDGMTIVDFMGDEIQSIASTMPSEFAELGSQAYEVARSAADDFESQGNAKLARRYNRLLHYMRPRLSPWGIDPNA